MLPENAIKSFTGKYKFLSNFYPSVITYEDDVYPTVEHAYQAAKTLDKNIRKHIRDMEYPGQTKAYVKIWKDSTFHIRTDWDHIKYAIMQTLVENKFENKELRQALIETGERELIEGNIWGDTYWGMAYDRNTDYHGENHLGNILMDIRAKYLPKTLFDFLKKDFKQ